MEESKFQIINQRLSDLKYSINENFSSKGIELKIDSEVEIQKDMSQNIAKVSLKMYIFREESIDEVPFKIEIQNSGHFKWENINNDELVDKFLNFNAPALLLSNIRSIITQLTAFSGFPALILPLYDFTK